MTGLNVFTQYAEGKKRREAEREQASHFLAIQVRSTQEVANYLGISAELARNKLTKLSGIQKVETGIGNRVTYIISQGAAEELEKLKAENSVTALQNLTFGVINAQYPQITKPIWLGAIALHRKDWFIKNGRDSGSRYYIKPEFLPGMLVDIEKDPKKYTDAHKSQSFR